MQLAFSDQQTTHSSLGRVGTIQDTRSTPIQHFNTNMYLIPSTIAIRYPFLIIVYVSQTEEIIAGFLGNNSVDSKL